MNLGVLFFFIKYGYFFKDLYFWNEGILLNFKKLIVLEYILVNLIYELENIL